MSTEKDGSKKLTRLDLLSMAVGQIIGVGIMTMTGIAIGMTGKSVNVAYLVAAAIIILGAVPQIFIGGTANFLGGQYSQIAILGGKFMAGVYTFVNLSMTLAISVYTLSFCDYTLSIIPGVPKLLISFIVLTAIIGMHMFGIKQAAKLQNIMSAILAISIASYIAFGIGKVQPGYFSGPDFFYGGASGFVIASILLTFAIGGATYVVNYSSEAKNPTKDIPFVIVASTLGVVVLYALIATIAAGVLPVSEVANQPLSLTAKTFMPQAMYVFFVVGGAMFALLTTLNFSIGMVVYPIAKACDDGWLPRKLATKNKKFGSYHLILLALYVVGMVPILLGLDIKTVANSSVILATSIRGVIAVAAMQLPKKLPELWNKSKYKTSNLVLNIVSVVTILVTLLSIVMLIITSPPAEIIGNIVVLSLAVVFSLIRYKKVNISASYTAT